MKTLDGLSLIDRNGKSMKVVDYDGENLIIVRNSGTGQGGG